MRRVRGPCEIPRRTVARREVHRARTAGTVLRTVAGRPSVALLLVASLLGCGSPEPEPARLEPLIDLSAIVDRAEVSRETREIRPGEPADRPLLGGGWSSPESDPGRDRSFAWSTGGAAEIFPVVLSRRPIEVVAEAWSYAGATPQTVTLEVDGRPVGTVPVSSRLETLRFSVEDPGPAGRQRWILRTSSSASPREVSGAADDRRLAVAWSSIRLGSAEPPDGSGAMGTADPGDGRADGGTGPTVRDGALHLPWGTQLAWFVELPARVAVEVSDLRVRGRGRVEVDLQRDAAGAETDLRVLDPTSPRLEFEGRPAGPTRLRLRAVGDESSGAGVVLRAHLLAEHEAADGTPPVPSAAASAPPPDLPRPRAIVVWAIDTLRADAIEITLSGAEPGGDAVRALAADGVVFSTAYAQSSWTRASMGSVWTGLLPPAHGAYRRERALSDDVVTLAERLRDAGWTTAAVVTNPNLTSVYGFDQGFDHFVALPETARAGEVVDLGTDWLEAAREEDGPLFLWLHPLEPHAPYDPPVEDRLQWAAGVDGDRAARSLEILDDIQAGRRDPEPALVRDLVALYRAEIESGDQELGRLIARLEDIGLWSETLFLFLSDHGEEMGEHGNWQHGRALHEESVRVPLILRVPDSWALESRRVDAPVQHVDLLPTLLEAAGLATPPDLPGRSLLGLLSGREPARRPILHHLHLDGPERWSVRLGRWKLIRETEGDRVLREALYDLWFDPGETRNLASERPVRTGFLAGLLRSDERTPGAGAPGVDVEIDDELRESLRALGYLN